MKSLSIAALALVLALSGCSSSELEKRNKFDACVIKWLKDYGYDFVGYNGAADSKAESECAYLLE